MNLSTWLNRQEQLKSQPPFSFLMLQTNPSHGGLASKRQSQGVMQLRFREQHQLHLHLDSTLLPTRCPLNTLARTWEKGRMWLHVGALASTNALLSQQPLCNSEAAFCPTAATAFRAPSAPCCPSRQALSSACPKATGCFCAPSAALPDHAPGYACRASGCISASSQAATVKRL